MRRYHGVLRAAAVRVSRRWGKGEAGEIDDIVQEIYLKLCAGNAALLDQFRETRADAIFGYLKVVSTNVAHDFYRHRAAGKRRPAKMTTLDDVSDFLGSTDSPHRRLTLAEVDRALVRSTQTDNGPRDRAIFRLYFRFGMTAQAISELPGISLNAKGVEAVLHRLTRVIKVALGETQEIGTN